MNNKRISIIIPTYNSSIILEENIKIISSYKQCKIFVIDDGSVSDEARKIKLFVIITGVITPILLIKALLTQDM